jgi:hypothetical protein
MSFIIQRQKRASALEETRESRIDSYLTFRYVLILFGEVSDLSMLLGLYSQSTPRLYRQLCILKIFIDALTSIYQSNYVTNSLICRVSPRRGIRYGNYFTLFENIQL